MLTKLKPILTFMGCICFFLFTFAFEIPLKVKIVFVKKIVEARKRPVEFIPA